MHRAILTTAAVGACCGLAAAGGSTGFEGLTEGPAGASFTDGGITFFGLNSVAGVNPDGSNFVPGEYGTNFIIEDATLAINDFPDYLSGNNVLSWGNAWIAGDNLSINILSDFSMTTGQVENSVTMDLLYFENGPWGGITISLDAMLGGSVVASDSLLISDLGGRDNLVGAHLSIDGVSFDSLRLSATMNGTATAFAGLVDNVVITPAPASAMLLGLGGLVAGRRRR